MIAGPFDQTVKVAVVSTLRKQLVDHSRDLFSLLSNVVLGVLSHAGSLIFIVLVPILSFFFLKDGAVIRSSVLGILAEGSRRDMINEIAADLHLLLAQYMRALVLLAAAVFLAYGVFFSLLGVPYGILLAAIAFPLEFIPMVGPAGRIGHHFIGCRLERLSSSALDPWLPGRVPRFPGLFLVAAPAQCRHATPSPGHHLRSPRRRLYRRHRRQFLVGAGLGDPAHRLSATAKEAA